VAPNRWIEPAIHAFAQLWTDLIEKRHWDDRTGPVLQHIEPGLLEKPAP
jgi:hypothetical protein